MSRQRPRIWRTIQSKGNCFSWWATELFIDRGIAWDLHQILRHSHQSPRGHRAWPSMNAIEADVENMPSVAIASSGLGHIQRGIEAWASDLAKAHASLPR